MTRDRRAVRVPIRRLTSEPDDDSTPRDRQVPESEPGDRSAAGDGTDEGRGMPDRGQAIRAEASGGDPADWQAVAMRLQADMQTYRRRQQRLAEERIVDVRADLLQRFLTVADNLEQSLDHLEPGDPVHQGVQVAFDGLLALLMREGVTRIFAEGKQFAPDLHEAIATLPVSRDSGDHMRVVEVLLPGYLLGERLLRPAKVVVGRDAEGA